MYCIFPVLKPLACGRQSRCLDWTYRQPGGQKFSFKLSALSLCRISQRTTLDLIKRPQFIKLPRGAIYKSPCAQLINNPFFAIHQVFALLNFGNIPVTTTTKIFPKLLRYKWEAYCNTNGRRTAIQMGGVLTLFPFLRA